MHVPHPRRPPAPLRLAVWVAWCCGAGWLVAGASAADEPTARIDLIRDVATAGDLTAPANGQTLYVLEESSGSVVAIDPFEPTKRWVALASPGNDAAIAPSAIASIDTGTLVVLSRRPNGWFLASHRVQPGITANPGEPVQILQIAAAGNGPGAAPSATRPGIAVSPSRDWLTVAGLEAPAAAVLRAPIAGARVGAISTRSCPQLAAGIRPVAVTVSSADEFLLFARDPAAGDATATYVSFFLPPSPRRLLHLDTGLPHVHDAAFCRADGTLWVVGGQPGSATTPEGLWRIDAVLRRGRQEAQAVCVARLDGAISLVCLSERAIIVTHGRMSRVVSRIDPTLDHGRQNDAQRSAGPSGAAP